MHTAPNYAIQIWIEGDDIKLCFNDAGQTHVVTLDSGRTGIPTEADAWAIVAAIKADERGPGVKPIAAVRGWAALKRTLRDRAEAHHAKIGEKASPTQHQLDQLVRSFGGTITVVGKKRAPESVSLEDLGL